MKKEIISGIYAIENMVNGKKYIGQGQDVKKRMNHYHKNSYVLNNAIKKYGKENFKRYVIVYCEIFELERLEIERIKIFHSHKSEWGYNIAWGGIASMTGRKHSEETKEKNRKFHLGKHPSDKTKKLISIALSGKNHPMWGKHHSEETKEKNRKYHLGKHLSDETKKLLSIASSGKNHWNFGKKSKNASSLYFGVSIKKSGKKYIRWVAVAKPKHVGTYKTELEAAKAYDQYVIENNINRPLNFPEDYNK